MGFPRKQPPRGSFPRPADGASIDINPPGFCWWRADGAKTYRLSIRRGGKVMYSADGLTDPVHLPTEVLPVGTYVWSVDALDESLRTIDTWGPLTFTIADGAPEQPWIDSKELLSRVPEYHPRVIFTGSELGDLRASAENTRRDPVSALIDHAEKSLRIPIPKEPDYDKRETRTAQRMAYTQAFGEFRKVIDNGVQPLAAAYLFTGDRRYGRHAAEILLETAKWDPEGISSILSPYGDEIGLSLVKCGARAYDWIWDVLESSERELIETMLVARANQMLRRLRDRHDFLAYPGESHAGRLPGYLCEHAIALAERSEAEEWLDYALRALCTVFPHWGGDDGGWAEGIGYGRAYNTILLPPFEAVRKAFGLNLWQRPFFRKVRNFFFYCSSPVGENCPFGDGGSTGNPRGTASLMIHHALLFRDPACRWWAQQANPNARRSSSIVDLILPDDLEPIPPIGRPNDAVFRGVGWAALHSDIAHPENDTFVLFKSSPYGSVSHSHADQNCFCIMKGGNALATSSGYYGPSYGMPHHAKWTRQTKAHCGILVNGEGQIDRSPDAKGKITSFSSTDKIGYVCGDATQAYGGKLTRFDRHVVLIRPGLVCIVDDLESREGSTFQWLLHAFEPFEIDPESQVVISRRNGTSLEFAIHALCELELSQSNRFDTPYNEGIPEEFHREVANHYHFRASTQTPSKRQRFVAFGIVNGRGESRSSVVEPAPDGWLKRSVEFDDGTATVLVQLVPGSPAPEGIAADTMIRMEWRSDEKTETMEINRR